MSTTSDMIDSLKRALAAGHLSVVMGDRVVRYRSFAEIREILGILQADLDKQNGIPRVRALRIVGGTAL